MVIQDIKYQKQYFDKFFGLTKREQERYRRSQRDKLIINLVLDKYNQSRLWDMRKVELHRILEQSNKHNFVCKELQ